MCSDYFKHAPRELAVYISPLLTALLIHSTMPLEFLASTVIPIPNGKGLTVTDAGNYRRIALSSIIGKHFDLVVLHSFSEQLCSLLQFGFKAKHSSCVSNTVNCLIVCFQECTHSSAFKHLYMNHVTRVSWNSICSRHFAVGNGGKQGGVISPILLCIYIDSLLGALQNY